MQKTWPLIAIIACGWILIGGAWSAADPVPAKPAGASADNSGGDKAVPDEKDGDKKDTEKKDTEKAESALANQQGQVAARFRELEKLLLRMAELTAPTDPRRAALLRQAVAQSKELDIDHQFDQLVELLRQERLSLVVKNQGEVQQDLARLLELLLSEDRSKRIENDKERIREYLKRVNKIIKEQKAVQGETARDGDPRKLADRQGDLSEKTGELAKNLAEDAAKTQPGEKGEKEKDGKDPSDKQKDGDKKGSDEKDADKKDGEKKQGEKGSDKPSDGDSKDKPGDPSKGDGEKGDMEKSDKKDKGDKEKDDQERGDKDKKDSDKKHQDNKGDDSQKPDGKPAEGQPSEGQSSEQEQNESPAQKKIEQAQRRMKEAQEKLEEAKREDAVEKQAEALKELEQAKADLEEILRQLREEEMARMLAMLESRFRKMLDAQVEVYEGTKRLDKVPEVERDRDDEIESGRLGRKEGQIAAEADKALAVLREEGSAVAFPEAVMEMRDDMEQVVGRLAQAKVGEVTQGIEKDIIAALEEMIAALKKAQKDMEAKNQDSGPAEGGDDEPPLVDNLAELKMIRALQMRVNLRTQRYAEMTKTEQAETRELLDALKRLSEREQRIHKVTRDIVVGRNR